MKKEYENPELIIEEMIVEDPILVSGTVGKSESETWNGFLGQ